MKTYTISAKERNGGHVIPLRRAKCAKDDAMRAAWNCSLWGSLCDISMTQGSKHVVTYRNGNITHLNGKEHKA